MGERRAKKLGAVYEAHDTILPVVSAERVMLMVESVAYFIYVGTFREVIRPKYVRFSVSIVGAGAQAAEVAVARTPLAACGASQTITILEANATLTDLTVQGDQSNTVAFSIVSKGIPPGVHVWAGLRTAMASTEPTILNGVQGGIQRRHVLTVSGASALATGAALSGVVPAFSTAGVAPYLILSQS